MNTQKMVQDALCETFLQLTIMESDGIAEEFQTFRQIAMVVCILCLWL
jgi:hypothetical protein